MTYCENCEKDVKLSEEFYIGGEEFECPECGASIVVPTAYSLKN